VIAFRHTAVALLAAGTLALGTVPARAQASAALPTDGPYERIALTANRSRVVPVPFDITRIAVTNPAVADAVVVTPREVLVDGKGPGTTSLIIWGATARIQYDVAVDPGVATLEQHFKTLFPGEDIRVSVSDEAVILAGEVSSNNVVLRAGEIATGAYAKSRVINLLGLPGGTPSQQVMLQVRFAEVNRRAVTELGAAFFSNRRVSARTTTQQYAAPDFDDEKPGGLVFSDFLNLFLFDRQEGLGVLIKALEQKGYFQSLAEPNLIAYNGQEASFLAGGEFPVPVIQGGGQNNGITVLFKEFGIRLNFRPTIAGDTIRLKVRPEVSSLDFNNGISIEGFRIPALTTRRAETDIELRDGQTFAVAGLLNNITQTDGAAVPILSKIPIIGNFFKSKADRSEQTELLVLITPRLVKPLDPDEVPGLPTDPAKFYGSTPETTNRPTP
jgi:pilus assembly protein CpaC